MAVGVIRTACHLDLHLQLQYGAFGQTEWPSRTWTVPHLGLPSLLLVLSA